MSDRAYLEQHGWHLVATRPSDVGRVHFWEHPHHQPDRHGFFTQSQAVAHQKQLDKGHGCDCIREGVLHE